MEPAQRAVEEIGAHDDPAKAIEAAIDAFYEAVAGAQFLVTQAERRLGIVGETEDRRRLPAVYEFPGGEGSRPRAPRTR
jgi:hypothetical protein